MPRKEFPQEQLRTIPTALLCNQTRMRNLWLEKRLSRRPRILNTLHRFRLVEAISQTNEAELAALAKYANDTRLGLEIGSFQGVAAAIIARNMSAEGILYCIDPWPDQNSHLESLSGNIRTPYPPNRNLTKDKDYP